MPRASRNLAYRSRLQLKAKYSAPGSKIMSFGVTKDMYYDIGFKLHELGNAIQLYDVNADMKLKNGDELLKINYRTVVGEFEVAKKMILLAYPGKPLRIFVRRRVDGSITESDYNSAESVTISEYQDKKLAEISLAKELEKKSTSKSTGEESQVAEPEQASCMSAADIHTVDADAHTEETNISKLLDMDNPRQLMGQLHIKTVKLQQARKEMNKLKSENAVMDDQLKKMKDGISQINNKCRFLKQPPLRYKYDPRLSS